jgi:beta-glucosidase-like glycosyl hydrolase
MKDRKGWYEFCFGKILGEDEEEGEEKEEDENEEESSMLSEVEDNYNKKENQYEESIKSSEIENQIKKRKILLLSELENLKEEQQSNEATKEANILEIKNNIWEMKKPLVSLVLQFDQVLTQRVLSLHIEWLENR